MKSPTTDIAMCLNIRLLYEKKFDFDIQDFPKYQKKGLYGKTILKLSQNKYV